MLFEADELSDSPRADAIVKFTQASRSSTTKRDPLKSLAKKIGLVLSGDGRTFLEPETDLEVVESAYNTEAYVRQGVDKYIDKMFKAGWKFVGKNPTTVEYITTRFAYMAEVTGIPTEKLFMEYCEDVVKFSNAVIAKSRMSDQAQLPSNLSIQGYANRQPVVGYFILPATTMTVNRDKLGEIKQWQQQVDGSQAVKYKPEDIIHTYYKRSKGNAFGTPFISPVLDDIRALREAEDNVLKMLYRNINPFYHIKIGSEEYPADDLEIEAARAEVDGMSVDGGLVTSERWEINSIAADKVVEAQPYLKYFEDRVFSGLGVPATMFGRGATANKSTSESMDAEFIDRVKAFQKITAADVDLHMINELLYEGGFDPILNPNDAVHFVFNEIDIDMKVKLENHAIFKYEHNSITEDEMRQLLSLDIITDRSKMYSELITIYELEREAEITAQYAAPTGTSSTTTKTTKSNEKGNTATNNKVKPKNQHNPEGKETKGKTKNDMEIIANEHIEELRAFTVDALGKYLDKDKSALQSIVTMISFKEELLTDINSNLAYNLDADTANIRLQRMFGHLRSGVVDAIKSIQHDGSIARESIVEIVNSVFKVAQNTTTQIFHEEV